VPSDRRPDGQDPRLRAEFTGEAMDRDGFTPHAYEAVTAAERARLMDLVGPYHRSQLAGLPVGEVSDRAYRDLIAWCRAEGIRLAFFWSPESPAYPEWYSPASRGV